MGLVFTNSSFSSNREILCEVYKPLQDTLIKRCVEIMDLDKSLTTQSSAISKAKSIWSKLFPKPQRSWLPTGCLVSQMFNDYLVSKSNTQEITIHLFLQQLLEVLHGVLPKMSLIASDFSYLPDVKVLGERAPLVSTKVNV